MKKILLSSLLIFLISHFFVGCKKENTSTTFSIDLANSNYSALNTPGAYLYHNTVVIARMGTTTFAALSEFCSHDNYKITYNANIGFFVCGGCGGRYNIDGTVAFGPPPSAIKKYNTSYSGTVLSVSP